LPKNYNRLSTVYERYRQTTDGRATAHSLSYSLSYRLME